MARRAVGCHAVSSEPPLRRILVFLILLIVYGSLYPWQFVAKTLPRNPLWILLHAWPAEPLRYFVQDTAVNIALYAPLGFVAWFAFRKIVYAPVLLGLLLSIGLEMAQLFTPTRVTSMMDVTANVCGTALGVALAAVFDALALRRPFSSPWRSPDRGALLLVIFWVGLLWFPFFPVLGFYVPSRKFAVLLHSPLFAPVSFLSSAAAWFAAGLLFRAAGLRIPRAWAAVALLAIPAQIFIATRQPLPAELAGAAAGVLLFVLRPPAKAVQPFEAWAFFAVLAFRGLAPFRFAPAAAAFDWFPFGGVLASGWQPALLVLTGKVFYYGAAIWLLNAAGMRLWRSAASVAALLAAIEIVQTHLPGRTPEITDPLLALFIGFGLSTLSREGGTPVPVRRPAQDFK